ncbi:hypothetical protein H6P81_014597 [Aristolochia fimbriata]|uniref:Late embryogenesis abundant protein LEA-2 subgroup domain-containing protein n=1 Tax=Aristolochia fimbriata TaxID=158543 RepID=A0AAV7E347_ARIFI|nr:hypothetical protein H6P81_014597 [Aristolochia fimbriata]
MANPAGPDPILPLPKPPGHEHRKQQQQQQQLLVASPPPPASSLASSPINYNNNNNNNNLAPQRRVSFSEPKKPRQQHQRGGGGPGGPSPIVVGPSRRPPERRRRSCCLTCCICCAWTFLVLLLLLLLLLLSGTLFYMWAQPESPEFQVERLSLSRLDLDHTPDGLAYLTTRLDLFLSSNNRNDKIGFTFGPTKVILTTTTTTSKEQQNGAPLDVGRALIPGFQQAPNNLTIVKVRAGVTDSLVPAAKAQRLVESFHGDRPLLLNAALKGSVSMTVGSWHSQSIDVRVDCKNIVDNSSNKNAASSSPRIAPRCEILLLGYHYSR